MEVFSFEPAEVVAEKNAARARAKEAAAAQALRELKNKKPRADPETTMEVDEEDDEGKGPWVGGMDMVREGSEMGTVAAGDAGWSVSGSSSSAAGASHETL